MIATREAISAALFALIQNAAYEPPVATFSRKYISSTDLGTANTPAIVMVVKDELAKMSGHGIPIKWVLNLHVFVFVSTADPNPDNQPETVLNNILDAIELAILPPLQPGVLIGGRQTLQGLVYDCRINGAIERDPGFIGGIGAAAIPIEITTTS
jgi:hypothetical protein